MTEYFTVAAPCEASVTEKRSEFIAQLFPAQDAEQCSALIAQVKAKHHKARHNVWAYVLRSGAVRYSDDGEPQGTGGIPVLSVLQKTGLSDVCCVVTRYFGGVLLGAPGLTRAYSDAAAKAVKTAQIQHFCEAQHIRLHLDYGSYPTVSYLLQKRGILVAGTDYGADVCMELEVRTQDVKELLAALTEQLGGQPQAEITETHFTDLNAGNASPSDT